jgi:hypothetical protein
MTSRRFLSFLLALGCFSLPAAWAGTYKAHCPDRPTCRVKLTGDRLIVDDKAVPLQAVSIWVKGGPGVQTNAALGGVGTILLGAPGLLLYGIQSFQSIFSISYFMPSGGSGQFSFSFDNVDESRFFETEFLAILGQPMGKERPEAKDFAWKESDYSVKPEVSPVN